MFRHEAQDWILATLLLPVRPRATFGQRDTEAMLRQRPACANMRLIAPGVTRRSRLARWHLE